MRRGLVEGVSEVFRQVPAAWRPALESFLESANPDPLSLDKQLSALGDFEFAPADSRSNDEIARSHAPVLSGQLSQAPSDRVLMGIVTRLNRLDFIVSRHLPNEDVQRQILHPLVRTLREVKRQLDAESKRDLQDDLWRIAHELDRSKALEDGETPPAIVERQDYVVSEPNCPLQPRGTIELLTDANPGFFWDRPVDHIGELGAVPVGRKVVSDVQASRISDVQVIDGYHDPRWDSVTQAFLEVELEILVPEGAANSEIFAYVPKEADRAASLRYGGPIKISIRRLSDEPEAESGRKISKKVRFSLPLINGLIAQSRYPYPLHIQIESDPRPLDLHLRIDQNSGRISIRR